MYSERLYETAAGKDYTLKTLERDIRDQRDQADRLRSAGQEDSNTLGMIDDQIALAKIAQNDRQAELKNDLKSQLAALNQAKAEWTRQKEALAQEVTLFAQKQRAYEIGLLSGLEFSGVQLTLRQAQLQQLKAAYAYDLRWQEYRYLQNGTQLVAYHQYQSSLLF